LMWKKALIDCIIFCSRISYCTLNFAFHVQRMWGFWVGLTKPMISIVNPTRCTNFSNLLYFWMTL
jgi:hypothetical protein